jgi:adenylate kinase
MKLVLIGIQGAGKSTQGNMLSAEFGIPYLSSGHVFRGMSKDKSPLGRWVKETINSGALIPDDKTLEIILTYLNGPDYTKGYILDGFPRTVVQAEAFEKAGGADKVIYLRVSDKEALWRLSGRVSDREDETVQAIRKRIGLFHELTEPVIEYYRDHGRLIEVDGEMEVQDVYNEILKHLK